MFAETHTPDNHNYYTIIMNDQVGIVDLLIDPKLAIGKDFHYECEMTMPDTPVVNALTEMAGFLSGGQPDIISIDGRVIFCDDEVAVVKVFHHYGEFDLYMFSYKETAERFPGFEDKNHVRESCYAWVSLEDGWFIPSDPALLKVGELVPHLMRSEKSMASSGKLYSKVPLSRSSISSRPMMFGPAQVLPSSLSLAL